jgi:ADP-ribose pyrophosphatase
MHIQKIEQLTHEKWLNLYAATFEHDGHNGRWVYASRQSQPQTKHSAEAVIIVPVQRMRNKPPRLVMVKEFRIPVGDYVYAFPAGLIDPGESIEEAARRELREETGLEVVAVHRVTQLTDEAVSMIFVDARAMPKKQPKLDASEDLQVLLLDFPAICRLCDDRSVRIEARAWTILYSYQQLGRLE